jgi:PAT family beta-lactamase induction signal transducer AmpG
MLYLRYNVLAVAVLGFASGLPLAMTGGTLTAWLAKADVDLTTIGLFALAATPYVYKFLWAPLVDQLRLPVLSRLGHRRSWLLLTEILLCALLIATSFLSPQTDLMLIAVSALAIAFCSATHDIVIDAYRIEILKAEELGAGAAAVTYGYRVGMIVSGGAALAFADKYGWQATYITISMLVFIGFLASLLIGEKPQVERPHRALATWFKDAVVDPFADFLKRERWLLILLFVVLYKLPDAFVVSLISPFLIKLGFTLTQIGFVVKTFGIAATIAGVFLGGWLIAKFGIMRSLMICATTQIFANLVFLYQAHIGNDINVLYAMVAAENITSGMATGVFVAYISALCKIDFTATQYALLSSLAAIGRTFLSASTGYLANRYGWELFFVFCAMLPLLSIGVLFFLKEPTALAESRKGMEPVGQEAWTMEAWKKIVLTVTAACIVLAGSYYYYTLL